MTAQADPDFHVVALEYELIPNPSVTYEAPSPLRFYTPEASFVLAEGRLLVNMTAHFADEGAARAAIEPVLRAWEAQTDLRLNYEELRFRFVHANVVDRAPRQPGEVRIHARGGLMLISGGTVTVRIGRATYPDPPLQFRLTADAESIVARYRGYREGREPLLSMAYFCLTVLESSAGGRRQAAVDFGLEDGVLRKLGELTSTRGDGASARKAPVSPAKALTGAESAWIEAAIRAIALKAGETRPQQSLRLLTLADLPAL